MAPHTQVKIYLLLFVVAFFLVLLLAPASAKLARRLGALDYPGYRKIHDVPLPRLGGLALFGSVVITFFLGYGINPYIRDDFLQLKGLIAGVLVVVCLGAIDDIWNLSPFLKFPVHLVAAGIAASLGTSFQLATNPLANGFRDYFDLGILGIPLTILWIVGLTNAMNLVDGLDGLATGISLFSSLALFLISIQQGAGIVTYVYVILSGATLAFLRFNRFPAKMFLGDTGSNFLGFTLACLAVHGTQKSYTLTALFIPVIVFGVPIFEAIVTLIRRYLAHTRLFEADGDHIHHRLMKIGLTQRQVVWLLYAASIILGILGFSFTVLLDEYAAMILSIVGFIGGFLAKELNLFGTGRRRGEAIAPSDQKLANK